MTAGCAQQSAYFDGDDAWGYPAANVSFAATDPFTIEFWFEEASGLTGTERFIDTRSNANDYGYSIELGESDIRFTFNCASGSISFASSSGGSVLGDLYWHHVAITKSSATTEGGFHFYIDGADIPFTGSSSVPIGGNCFVSSSTDKIWFGRDADSAQNFYKGNLDEVRIWNAELPSSTISNYADEEVSTASANLRGYWRFNAASTDLIGNNPPSVASGSPTFSTSTPFGHFVLSTSSVDLATKQIRWTASTTYMTEWSAAVNMWNGSTSGAVSIFESSTNKTLDVYDVNLDDVSWFGEWDSAPNPDEMHFNIFRLASTSSAKKQHTVIHELGHALKLDHSILGNMMYPYITEQVTLGVRDLFDYEYLW